MDDRGLHTWIICGLMVALTCLSLRQNKLYREEMEAALRCEYERSVEKFTGFNSLGWNQNFNYEHFQRYNTFSWITEYYQEHKDALWPDHLEKEKN